MTSASEMFKLARMVLHDQCPPDNTCYLCKMGECPDEGTCCLECWENYLLWAVNGYPKDKWPYRHNRLREDVEVHGARPRDFPRE